MTERPISAVLARSYDVAWWPGRTDEVRRVADWLRKVDQPDGRTTNGQLAAALCTSVFIVVDAIDMNATVDETAECLITGDM